MTAAGSATAPICRDAILLEGTELPARAMAVGGVSGRVAKP